MTADAPAPVVATPDASASGSPGRVTSRALPRPLVALFAVACGLAVANVYYAHPVLDAIAASFGISQATVGIVVTVTQIGYGIGLVLLVPLGDVLDRRRLIVTQLVLSTVALVVVGVAPSTIVLLAGMVMVGVLAVVTQVLVAFAATVAGEHERGAVVGTVTSGVVIGILLARTFAGAITDVAGWRAVYLVVGRAHTDRQRAVVAVPAEPAPTSAADRLPAVAALDAHAVRDGTDAADPGRPGHADLRRLQRALDVAPPAAARASALDVTRRDRVARPGRSGGRARCRAGRPARRSRSRPGHHRRGAGAAVGVLAADRARAALAAGARRRSRRRWTSRSRPYT